MNIKYAWILLIGFGLASCDAVKSTPMKGPKSTTVVAPKLVVGGV